MIFKNIKIYFSIIIQNILKKKLNFHIIDFPIDNKLIKNEDIIKFEDNSGYLFSIVRNYKLYENLIKSLNNNKFFKKRKFNQNMIIHKYNLVINTDNYNFITKRYFSKKILKKYNSVANITVIKHDKITNNVATQIFTKLGPLAFLPISNYETSVVYSINNQNSNQKKNY